ncbi:MULTISPECIES: GGDEF domain-containing protein [Planktothricoides]|uniref:GGDEF domain-containing protein n=1 Tax=Planktothricoides raciborskii GIHE-MW2 TaxID=2792601 RepID=A0AAU8JMH1_9CYAN|nr:MULTISPECIES: GGDEF domain-containing protein [Planktothricoides]
MLPEVSLEETQKIAEKIRLGVKQLNLKSHHQSVGAITISLGVAIFPQDGWTSDQLLESADQALYRANKEGRDRVVTASEPEKSPPLLKVLS